MMLSVLDPATFRRLSPAVAIALDPRLPKLPGIRLLELSLQLGLAPLALAAGERRRAHTTPPAQTFARARRRPSLRLAWVRPD